MGILSVVRDDIVELVKSGFSDREIEKSVGIDLRVIENIIHYIRKDLSIDSNKKINNNGVTQKRR